MTTESNNFLISLYTILSKIVNDYDFIILKLKKDGNNISDCFRGYFSNIRSGWFYNDHNYINKNIINKCSYWLITTRNMADSKSSIQIEISCILDGFYTIGTEIDKMFFHREKLFKKNRPINIRLFIIKMTKHGVFQNIFELEDEFFKNSRIFLERLRNIYDYCEYIDINKNDLSVLKKLIIKYEKIEIEAIKIKIKNMMFSERIRYGWG
jgi:hypothetical protein